jgi:hypothetical protein
VFSSLGGTINKQAWHVATFIGALYQLTKQKQNGIANEQSQAHPSFH